MVMSSLKNIEGKEKAFRVLELFNKIAPVYDLLNDIISMKQHRRWKNIAIDQLEIKKGDRILDLCCGSGDITLLILKKFPEGVNITAVDFSASMLEVAEKRLKKYKCIDIIRADAMKLPFEDGFFDKIIISFGLRNLENIFDGLNEMKRVLKTGGHIVNIDFGKPEIPVFKALFWFYFCFFVPLTGKIFDKFSEYAYLPESIATFPPPAQLIKIMSELDFKNPQNRTFFMGFVAVQKATK